MVVDAGIGVPSDAAQAMEAGADAVLVIRLWRLPAIRTHGIGDCRGVSPRAQGLSGGQNPAEGVCIREQPTRRGSWRSIVSEHSLADQLRVYLVVGSHDTPGGLLETLEAALLGGVTAVQLREKSGTDLDTLQTAERVRELCVDHGAAFFLNDRVDLALAAGANGVHLGVDDLPIPAARRMAGPRFVIGFSPDTDTGVGRRGSKERTILASVRYSAPARSPTRARRSDSGCSNAELVSPIFP